MNSSKSSSQDQQTFLEDLKAKVSGDHLFGNRLHTIEAGSTRSILLQQCLQDVCIWHVRMRVICQKFCVCQGYQSLKQGRAWGNEVKTTVGWMLHD
jgi:hypothetical protein